MAFSIPKKLRITAGLRLLTKNAPPSFSQALGELPEKVTISSSEKKPDQVHWFVRNRKQLEKEMSSVMKLLKPGVIVWVYYPKGTSGLQEDLTRDKGWDCLLAEKDKLTWINLISFDETWSVFGFRTRSEAEKKTAALPRPPREIFNWIDPVKKEVRLPDDVSKALGRNKEASAFFQALPFSHKKEYIEWIVTAKKQETRDARIAGTIERLGQKWKNPANRK